MVSAYGTASTGEVVVRELSSAVSFRNLVAGSAGPVSSFSTNLHFFYLRRRRLVKKASSPQRCRARLYLSYHPLRCGSDNDYSIHKHRLLDAT